MSSRPLEAGIELLLHVVKWQCFLHWLGFFPILERTVSRIRETGGKYKAHSEKEESRSGSRGVNRGRVQKSQVKNWKTADWAKEWGISLQWSVVRGEKSACVWKIWNGNIYWHMCVCYPYTVRHAEQCSILPYPLSARKHSKPFGSSVPFSTAPYLMLVDHEMATSSLLLICVPSPSGFRSSSQQHIGVISLPFE